MTKNTFKKFEITDHLKTSADCAAYLRAAFEDGSPQMISIALGDVARAQGMTKVAQRAQLDRVNLYRALSDHGDPRLSTLTQVIQALGYHLSITAN